MQYGIWLGLLGGNYNFAQPKVVLTALGTYVTPGRVRNPLLIQLGLLLQKSLPVQASLNIDMLMPM